MHSRTYGAESSIVRDHSYVGWLPTRCHCLTVESLHWADRLGFVLRGYAHSIRHQSHVSSSTESCDVPRLAPGLAYISTFISPFFQQNQALRLHKTPPPALRDLSSSLIAIQTSFGSADARQGGRCYRDQECTMIQSSSPIT